VIDTRIKVTWPLVFVLLLYAAAQMIVGSALGKALARCGGYD
jgi:hypothetical protein